MKEITLLPADTYRVVNKTILTEYDKKIIINLYQPIIGPNAISLYLTLISDLDNKLSISDINTHHHLMISLKNGLNEIKKARNILEAVGLIKTYIKELDKQYDYICINPFSIPLNLDKMNIFNLKDFPIIPCGKNSEWLFILISISKLKINGKATIVIPENRHLYETSGNYNKIRELIDIDNPSRELIQSLIDKIIIDKDKNIEIIYKFSILNN